MREWNKPFTADSSIDLIDPDLGYSGHNNMDATDNIDGNYIGTTWNQFYDFDDPESGYDGGVNACTEDGA